MKRRAFLIGASAVATGGLVLGYRAWDYQFEARARELAAGAVETLLCGWMTIAPDDTVTVHIPHVDMGQGTHTALAMMLAEELDADWSRVRAVQAPADRAFANRFLAEGWTLQNRNIPTAFNAAIDTTFAAASRLLDLQITGGSSAVRMTGQIGMRVIGAAARDMLIRAAAKRWDIASNELSTLNSMVIHTSSGRRARYADLVEEAATLSVPSTPRLKARSDFKLIGRPLPRLDIPQKVTGELIYGIDLSLPGMLYAAVKSAPVHGGKLVSADVTPALAVPGVEHAAKMESCVAVIGRGYWQATRGLDAINPEFDGGGGVGVSTASIYARQATLLENAEATVEYEIGDADAVLAGTPADRIVDRVYRVPFLHHAAMEPLNVTAQFRDGRLTVWAGEQDPLGARAKLIELSGLDAESVEVRPLPVGGSFGRRGGHSEQYLGQALELARRTSPHPVKVLWSRAEDFAQGTYRPQLTTRMRAALGADGLPTAWSQVYIAGVPSRSQAFPIPYGIVNQSLRAVEAPIHIHTGALRSVNHTQHGFWTESFIDELAHAAGRDPLAYRRSLVAPGSREDRVLASIAEVAQWRSPLPAGVGRGVAMCECYGSIVAEVVEASLNEHGRPRIHRVVAVVDCGEVVHPDTAAQQVEGAILMGLSTALMEQITVEHGAVEQTGFADYRVLTLADTPDIEVHFLRSDGAWGGLGEPGLPPAAPALANALFAAAGLRARTLPIQEDSRHSKLAAFSGSPLPL